MCNKVCSVYGKDTVSIRMCQKTVCKFRSGVLLVKDWSRPGWPTEINTDEIKVLVDENPKMT